MTTFPSSRTTVTTLLAGREAFWKDASDAYLAKTGENGNFLLMHCVGDKPGWYGNPKSGEVDVSLNSADYCFLEALGRFERLIK